MASEQVMLWRVARHMRRPLGTWDHELMSPLPPVSLAEPQTRREREERERVLQAQRARARSVS